MRASSSADIPAQSSTQPSPQGRHSFKMVGEDGPGDEVTYYVG